MPAHPDPRVQFIEALARSLHEAGAPAHRLEDTVDACARALGLQVDCLSQPTSLILGIGDRTRVVRVQPGNVHLARLVALDAVGTRVARGELEPGAGLAELVTLTTEPPPYPLLLDLAAAATSSAVAAVFLHGSASTVMISGAFGALVAGLGRLARRFPEYGRVHELAAAVLVSAGATALARLVPLPVAVVTLTGLIALLPGFTLTVALTELATRHLAAGTARLMGAIVTFLQLGLGSALGWRLAEQLPRALRNTNLPLDDAWTWVALPLGAVAFTVILRARPRDFPMILGVAGLGFLAARQGQAWLGPELGASIGGLAVGLASNLQARVRKVPTAVTQVPGLLLLVPGSIGFRSFGAMFDDDVTAGVGAAFSMTAIAGALVGGILLAGLLLPPRKWL